MQNFFVYCLTKSEADPIEFLTTGPHPVPAFHVASWSPQPSSKKDMWCTGPMFHAAGWKIYQRGTDDFVALPPTEAEKVGLTDKGVEAFGFEPIHVTIESTLPRPIVELDSAEPNCYVFRATDDRYRQILASCLKNLLAGLGDTPQPR